MKIVRYPHPALRHRSRPLTSIDERIRRHAAEMLELMYASRGIGLAANQVALPYQLFVLNTTGDPEQRELERVCINPVVLERKGTVEGEEGCLSFPGLFQKVRRAKTVKVQAYNMQGEAVEITASDLAARCWQHEIDHLNGVMFIAKMGPIARLASRGSLKTFEQEFRDAQKRGEIPPDSDIEKMLQALEQGLNGDH
jgi:peptide deformylase